MRYERKPAFDRAFRRLPRERQARTKQAIQGLITFFETRQQPPGLGLKRLQGDFWEIRAGLGDRVMFRLTGTLVEFVIAGNHDEIRKFLRNAS